MLTLLLSIPGLAPDAAAVDARAAMWDAQEEAAANLNLASSRSVSAPASVDPPVLRMVAESVQVEPGESVAYSVAITNAAGAPLTTLVLNSAAPAGMAFVPGSASGFVWSPRDRQLTWNIGQIEAGQSLIGGFSLRTTALGVGAVVTATVSATSPDLAQLVQRAAVVEVAPPASNSVWAIPATGGWLRSRDRRVDLRLPRQAVPRRTRISYQSADQPPLPEHIFYAFSLEAEDENGAPVHQFDRSLTLSAFFDPRQLPPHALDRLSLFHFDEASGAWELVPSRVEPARRRVVAQVEHFSKYGFGYNDDYMEFIAERMGVLRGAQTNLFSLSVGYRYAMQLPAGQGGLTPMLALNYSSANHTPASGHFSYVGFGWELAGADSIYIPPGDSNRNKVTLSLQGQTYSLHEGANGWYAEEDPFLKIATSNVSHNTARRWIVWTQDGTKYTFDADAEAGSYYWLDCANESEGKRYVRVPLRTVQDTSGNSVTYTWQTVEERSGPDDCPYFKRATRLTEITYNNGATRVNLIYADRVDRPEGFNSAVWRFYNDQRLTGVAVEVKDLGNGPWRTVRSYTLDQSAGAAPNASQKVLNLDSIQERSAGNDPLPPTSFSYSDASFGNQGAFGALQTVVNGYGGEVVFDSDYRDGSETSAHVVSARTEKYGVADLVDQSWGYSGIDWDASGDEEMAEGYKEVHVTRPDGALEEHYFHTIDTVNGQMSDHRAGREWQRIVLAGAAEMARSETVWEASTEELPVEPAPGSPEQNVPRHVRVASVEAWEAGQRLTRTTYLYDATRQGGMQWGNVTHISEYVRLGSGWSSLPVRTTYNWYYPNPALGITTKPARVELHKICAGCAGGMLISQRLLYYDQNSAGNYQLPPSKGLLRFEKVGLDPLLQTTELQYWPNGNPRKVIDANYNATETFYDWGFKAYPVCVINALGHVARSRYFGVPGSGDPEPGVSSACDHSPAGSSMVANDAFYGQVEQTTDANGAVTSSSYDAWGRLIAVWLPGDEKASGHGATQLIAYGPYDGAGAPFKVQLRRREDLGGGSTTEYLDSYTFYDGFGRAVQTQSEAADAQSSIVSNTRYNGLDQTVRQNVPYLLAAAPGTYRVPDWNQPFIATTHDELGRVEQTTNTDGSTQHMHYRYVQTNREVAVVDEARHQEIRELDAFGRLVQSRQYQVTLAGTSPAWTAAAYAVAQYTYDVADRLTDVAGPAGITTTITYDDLGRKESMDDPDMGEWSYGYDLAGNLKRQTDARGQTICFYYDALNRLIGKHGRDDASCPAWSGGALTPLLARYYYDESGYGSSKGRRTRAVTYAGVAVNNTVSTTYDARGRTVGETLTVTPAGFAAPLNYTTNWTFDTADRVRTTTYPDAGGAREVVTTAYNAQGLPVSLTSASGGVYVSATTYDALGRLTSQTLGNGNFVQRNYWGWSQSPGRGRLKRILVHDNALETTLFLDLAYHYDAAGNIARIIDTTNAGQQECFVYDALNRLTSGFTSGDGSCTTHDPNLGADPYDETYTYDAAGRITGKGDLILDYDSAQPVHAPQRVSGVSLTYDEAGNLESGRQDAYDSPRFSYSQEWNAENRLAAVRAQIGATTIDSSFGYDGDGRRVWKRRLDTTSIYPGAHFEQVRTPLSPLGVNVEWFEVSAEADHNLLTWVALDESHTVGYNVYRSADVGGPGQRLNAEVMAAHYYGQHHGDSYSFADYGAPPGEPVYYWLEEVTDEPGTLLHGPATPDGGPVMAQRTPETVYDIYRSAYFLGNQRIALRKQAPSSGLNELYYLFTDHLGTVRLESYGSGVQAGDLRAATPALPYGGVRTAEPESHHWFTGQYLDRSEDLYDYGARPYDPLLGLFIQPDTIVPEPGNPQALNRYSYVLNNPVRYRDPSGHAPQYPDDADPNNAACATDWCWQNRWYLAHNYHWSGGGWSLGALGSALFYDAGILDDVLAEAGIAAVGAWDFGELSLVGQGVVDLMNTIGSANGLSSLFDPPGLFQNSPSVKLKRGTVGWGTCAGMGACTLYDTVWFFSALFSHSDNAVRTTAVHELGHVLDHKHLARQASLFSQMLPGYGVHYLTNYGESNHSEYWAEAIAIWVYGGLYKGNEPGRQGLLPLQVQMLEGWLLR